MLESRLRDAQCRDSLQDIRNKIQTLHHLRQYKKANVRHQGPNTRARSELDRHAAKRDRAVEKYRRARRAKLALDGAGEWETVLRELRDEDIRGGDAKRGRRRQQTQPKEEAQHHRKRARRGPQEDLLDLECI